MGLIKENNLLTIDSANSKTGGIIELMAVGALLQDHITRWNNRTKRYIHVMCFPQESRARKGGSDGIQEIG